MTKLEDLQKSMDKFIVVINKDIFSDGCFKSVDPKNQVAFDKVREMFILIFTEMKILAKTVDEQLQLLKK